VELFRGDATRGFVFEARSPALADVLAVPPDQPLVLSISQLLALAIAAVGLYGLRASR
jgi:hypothetical protein